MNRKLYTISFLFALFFLVLFFSEYAIAGNEKTDCSRPAILLTMLDKYHYSPVEMNDSVSQQIFDSFLKMADPYLTFFTDAEIKQLSPYRTKLDDEIKNKSCGFLNLATRLYKQQLKKADSLITEITKQPFDFTAHDTMFFSHERSSNYADNESQLKKRWSKWLKYQTLSYLFAFADTGKNHAAKSSKELLTAEPEIRAKIAHKEKQYIERVLDDPMGFDNLVSYILCNAIANRFDPHTLFFSPDENEEFREQLSSEVPSFGLSLQESENGGTQIASLVPGGPAWKSNELNEGDVLTKVQWPDGRAIDLTLTDPDELEDILHISTYNLAEFTVKKPNGLLKKVKLAKELLHSDENVINGLVLQGEKKIGYISLPGFYTQWENETGHGCSNDVAKEIMKLKSENISGLILDLRNNGGGSMEEALNLAGIFIDEGPLCILQSRGEKPMVMKDMNRGTLYDGPLEIMVNGGSASASELLAATLQDYHRALIVGSPTFGKATAQVILPMDTNVTPQTRKEDVKSQAGYVNMTVHKFYRVTGASHQSKGVIPDVVLPEIAVSEIRESTEPFALSSDSAKKKVIYTVLSVLPSTELAHQSASRIAQDERFQKITALLDSLHATNNKDMAVPLELEAFRKCQERNEGIYKSFDNLLTRPASSFTVSNNKFDQGLMEMDTYNKEINDALLKQTHEDIYLEEAFRIMLTLTDLTK